jgi:hypothetical protein
MLGIQKNNKPKLDTTVTGLLCGIFVPIITFVIVYFVMSGNQTLNEYLQRLFDRNLQGHFISISVIPNLLVFFIFIWLYKMKAARGVLLSTFLWAFLILAIRLFG